MNLIIAVPIYFLSNVRLNGRVVVCISFFRLPGGSGLINYLFGYVMRPLLPGAATSGGR